MQRKSVLKNEMKTCVKNISVKNATKKCVKNEMKTCVKNISVKNAMKICVKKCDKNAC